MIYNQLNLNNYFNTQATSQGTNPKVFVEYNGKSIHNITGPVPVVEISYSFENNGNNLPESLVTSITLNGKIFRLPEIPAGGDLPNIDSDAAGPGFSGIISGVNALKNLFQECTYNTLSFKCAGANSSDITLYEISGLYVKELSFNNTEDNWTQTADYSISLEAKTSLYSGDPLEKMVTERQDSWSIEPIEDTVYHNFYYDNTIRNEYSNPKLGRTNNGPSNSNATTENARLRVITIPQFRITRKLSAKGLMPPNKVCNDGLYSANTKPYVFAKAWVEKMAEKSFGQSTSTPSTPNTSSNSAPYFQLPFTNNSKLFPFNHNRTVNIDIYNGTYEINDSWLAMPTGTPYTETYTVEVSSGEDYIKTVRVAGNIIGLSIANQELMEASGMIPSGTGNSGIISANLDPSAYMVNGQSGGTYTSLDYDSPGSLGGASSAPPAQTMSSERYLNALNAWLNHIKPFLYRRASIAINSSDRTLSYVKNNTNPPTPPNNPIYCKETLLSIIPIGTNEGHDPRKGSISYSYEYNNKLNIIPGVIAENISVSYDNPVDNTTELPVIGRALGPIIQRTSRSVPRKTINVEISIPPATGLNQVSMNQPACAMHRTGFLFKAIEQLIEANRPYSPSTFLNDVEDTEGLVYTSSDQETWNPTSGKYSRSVSWVYQQATITKDFRNH